VPGGGRGRRRRRRQEEEEEAAAAAAAGGGGGGGGGCNFWFVIMIYILFIGIKYAVWYIVYWNSYAVWSLFWLFSSPMMAVVCWSRWEVEGKDSGTNHATAV